MTSSSFRCNDDDVIMCSWISIMGIPSLLEWKHQMFIHEMVATYTAKVVVHIEGLQWVQWVWFRL